MLVVVLMFLLMVVRMIVRVFVSVHVRVFVIMSVVMIMAVRMSVPVIVSMIVPMMRMSERHQADHIDSKAQCTDNQELLHSSELPAFHDALHCFPNKLYTDQHEEHTVTKPGQCVQLSPAIWHLWARGPLACYCGRQADNQAKAVEEHVDSIREEAKRIGQVAIETLDKHEGEVQAGEVCNPSRVLFDQNAVDQTSRLTSCQHEGRETGMAVCSRSPMMVMRM